MRISPSFFGLVASNRARVEALHESPTIPTFHANVHARREQVELLARVYKRDSHGRFGSGGVRESLADAKTTGEIADAMKTEAKKITGRDLAVDFSGSDPQIAREHAEGVLQGLERFPAARLERVDTYGAGGNPGAQGKQAEKTFPDAIAVTSARLDVSGKPVLVSSIHFNNKVAADPDAYRSVLGRPSETSCIAKTPVGTGLHEFGHVIANHDSAMPRRVLDEAVRQSAVVGQSPSRYLTEHVSQYAAADQHELAAEVFADTMSNGSSASAMSQSGFDIMESAYNGSVGPGNTLTDLPRARTYKRDKDGKFGSGGGSPDAMHEEAQIRAAYTFTDPETGFRTEVDRIARPGDKNPDINDVRLHPTVPPGRTVVAIRILDANGNQVGEASRTIHPASQARVNHNSLVLDEGQRGQGFATRLNAHSEEVYRANGIKMVTLHANLDVGGYAWARAGYDFRNDRTRNATTANAYVASIKRGDSREVINEFRDLHRAGGVTPLDIAMVGHTPGATTWPGKEVMLESDWQGVKVL